MKATFLGPVSLLLMLGCNSIFGIEEATCDEPCAGNAQQAAGAQRGLPESNLSEGERQPDASAVSIANGVPATPDAAGVDAGDVSPTDAGVEGLPLTSDASADGGVDQAQCRESFVCQGAELLGCDSVLTEMVLVESCVSAALCNAAQGVCEPPACTPGELRCQAAQLQVCDASGTEFALRQECVNAALCDEVAGSCVTPGCSPGERRCSGNRLEQCNADRTGFTLEATCASAALCNVDQGCVAPVCASGQVRCSGVNLQHCSVDGSGFETVERCERAALCNQAEDRCNECVPGESRCLDSDTVATCEASGLTESTDSCLSVLEECQGGECTLLGGLPL